MKGLFKYIYILFLGVICNHSYGQLILKGSIAPGQYYNPAQVNMQPNCTSPTNCTLPNTEATGNSSGPIHLFINASSVTQSTSYASQLPTSILGSGSNTGPNTSL